MDIQEKTDFKHALVFTGGDWNPEKLHLPAADFVIAADAGYEKACALHIIPHLFVGDFDSTTADRAALPTSIEIIQVPCEKDMTDTMLACDLAIERGCTRITIVGGTGGRADHGLANILYLENLEKRSIDAMLTDGENQIRVCRNRTVTLPDRGGYFSVFALDNCVVTLSGCKYPLHRAILQRDYPYAVSNEILGDAATVIVEGTAVIIESSR